MSATATTSRPSQAWVLLGDLWSALSQAGYIKELLASGYAPSVLVGAGVGAINALLAASADAHAFTKAWEQLRGRRFVIAAALDEAGGLAARFAPPGAMLCAARDTAARVSPQTLVVLASGERFLLTDSMEGSRSLDLLEGALRRTDVEPNTIAAAISAAVAQCDSEVLVWGADQWAASSPLVLKAREDAASAGVAIRFVEPDTAGRPSLLELLLPGSGAVERSMARGAQAARKYLADFDEGQQFSR